MGKSKRLRTRTKAAKMGDPRAMYQLGLCFETGNGAEKDMAKAAAWIFAAADAGYAPAAEWVRDYAFDDSPLVQAES